MNEELAFSLLRIWSHFYLTLDKFSPILTSIKCKCDQIQSETEKPLFIHALCYCFLQEGNKFFLSKTWKKENKKTLTKLLIETNTQDLDKSKYKHQ